MIDVTEVAAEAGIALAFGFRAKEKAEIVARGAMALVASRMRWMAKALDLEARGGVGGRDFWRARALVAEASLNRLRNFDPAEPLQRDDAAAAYLVDYACCNHPNKDTKSHRALLDAARALARGEHVEGFKRGEYDDLADRVRSMKR